NDNVALTVNGVGGTSASDNLLIHVVDDVPTAHNDGPYAVVEDGAGAANTPPTSTVSGDVLANDVSGADAPKAFVAWSGGDTAAITALSTYGTLTQNSNGTWSYVLDNSKAATQALTSASHLSYDLHYTMTDADGDTSPATLTITINGADDTATVVTAQAQGPDNTVFEAGLNPDGSNAASSSETSTGSFSISATDGIKEIVIGGTTFSMAQIQGFNGTQTVNTGEGVLTLTGYTGDAHSGTVAYSYTLTATIDNDSKVPAPGDSVDGSGFNDNVALTVNGVGGTSASDNLLIHVIDDVPTANADIGNVNEGALLTVNAAAGVLANDVAGADGATIDGVRAAGGNTTTPVAGGVGTDIAGLHGTLHLNADGSYTYQSTANNIAANTTDVFVYTLKDGDGDLSTTTLTINLTDAGLVAPADNDVTVNEAALDTTTTGADLAHGSVTGSLPGSTAETDASNQLNATGNFTPLTYQLVSGGNAATAGTYGTIQVHTDGSYVYTLTSPVHGPATAGTDTVNAAESFTYQVTDANGNTTTGTINIAIIDDVPTANADIGNVNEGALLTVTAAAGVLANDVAGADGATIDGVRAAGGNTTTPVSGGVGTDIAGLHGTLHLNADGSYTYQSTANNIAANTTDVFVYTLKDGDGDLSTTTMTINLTDAGLVAPADNDVTVNEAALDTTTTGADLAHGSVTGSLPGSTAETDASNQLNATGGVGALTYTAQTIVGTYGTIHINTDGSYVYTLTSNYLNATANNGVQTISGLENFTYTVTDSVGNTATGSITVNIIDDVPTLGAFTAATIPNEIGSVAGPFSLVPGADGIDHFTIAGPAITGITYNTTTTADGTTVLHGKSGVTEVFSLTVKPDGTYQFDLVTPQASTVVTSSLANLASGNNNWTELADGSIEFSSPGSVNSSTQGFGVGNNFLNNGETFTMEFHTAGTGVGVDNTPASNPNFVDAVNFTVNSANAGEAVTWTATDTVHNVTQSGTAFVDASGTHLLIDPTISFNQLVVTGATAGESIRLTAASVTQTILPSDLNLQFQVTATDKDGDTTAAQSLNVHVVAGDGSGNFTLTGTAGNDAIAASSHADTMTGGAGADTFIIGTGESTPVIGGSGNAGTISGYDIITDFVAGTDKLTLPGTLAAATAGLVDGAGDSVLTIGGDTVESHSVTNGIASFFGTDAGASPLAITTTSGVAAAVQYLMGTDIGNAGATLAFTATISGVNHTYVYTQTTASAGVGALVDLQGVTVANLNTLIGGSVDPIILDLNHNGFTFSDVSHGVQFDMNGDGTKEQLAWNTSKDGVLAVDLNHDGKIDDGNELFTPNFGGGHFASGAAALASLDSNHDGVIDHNDATFSSLLIWKDANANGTSDAGELSSLADNGVASISTAAHPGVGEIDGQAVTGNGTFQMTDGTSGNYIEVELDTSLVAPAQPSVASDGTRTFAIGSLEVADLIADFHDGANGDKIDLSSLLKGLAGVTDLEAGGFVEISQSSANAANAEVKVDTNGGGDNYHTVAVLENYTFHSAAEAVKILYDDSHGTKTDVA
ncbi:beta strand repeat-containing protein, partial [Mesorhizobium sp. 98Argb]